MMRIIAVLVIAGLLGACTRAGPAAEAAKERTKEAKDISAGLLSEAPCLIGLGAWSRMDDKRLRDGIFYTCVSDAERYGVTLTVD